MIETLKMKAVVTGELSGKRLDRALSILFPEHSRSRLQQWIKKGDVYVNNRIMRQRDPVKPGDCITIITALTVETSSGAEAIPLHVLYADGEMIVLNKPAGMVVHPGAGNSLHTLMNALLHYDPDLVRLPRAGIIHRLDKDTTGIMVVARNPGSHSYLVKQLQQRAIRREYLALVSGVMKSGGKVEKPVGRHPVQRTRMAVTDKGKPAVTHFRIQKKYPAHTLIRVQLETGRTHQIRVHMASLHHPVVGDPAYGGRTLLPRDLGESVRNALQGFRRQALHACALDLTHRITGVPCHWEAPLPDDFRLLLALLDNEQQ